MPLTPTQITDLLALAANGTKIQVCEYLRVEWQDSTPGPEVIKYYGSAAYHQVPPFTGIGFEIEARLLNSPFREFEINPDLRSETMDLVFDDIDKDITAKFQTYKSGVKCELFYYYPQIAGHHQAWFGQLQAPQVYGWKSISTVATNGFRSREMMLPGRTRQKECNGGMNFGGSLPSQDAVNTNGCPYDIHVGGPTGLMNGPNFFTDCPGLARSDCIARFGHDLFWLGYDVDASAVVTDPRSGYIARSKGNESSLKEPIRVIAGSKKVRGLQLLQWRREINASNQDRGFVRGIWEVSEGPVQSISGIKVKEKLVEQLHIDLRLGQKGQSRTGYSTGVSNYSKTAHFAAAYGWTNPLNENASTIPAECDCVGFNYVANYVNTSAGNGLIGQYHHAVSWADLRATRIDATINFPSQISSPFPGILDNDQFSIRWTGQIKPRYSETYTFKISHDNGVKLWVNNVVVIDQLGTSGTHTGTIALTADTLYDIRIDFFQLNIGPPGPWECILKWSSASQTEEVVPYDRLFNGGSSGFVRQWTNNRVWWLLEFYTNQSFGLQYPASRFNIPTWYAASTWGLQEVTFTHTFPDGEVKNFPHRRTKFDAVIEGRPAAEQIEDICRSGAISVPYIHDGQFEVRELRVATTTELTNARVFTDKGESRNIIWNDGQPSISLSQIPDDRLTNEIVVVFEDASNDHNERPITVDDKDQKLKAGRSLGGNMLQTVPQKYAGFGITVLGEAIKFGYRQLWFGQFDEGGIQNNLRATFITPYEQTLGIRKYEIIKIESNLLNGFLSPQNEAFQYFRVLKMRKISNGLAEVIAQAYNHTKYSTFETVTVANPDPNPVAPLPGVVKEPSALAFGSASYDTTNQQIVIPIT